MGVWERVGTEVMQLERGPWKKKKSLKERDREGNRIRVTWRQKDSVGVGQKGTSGRQIKLMGEMSKVWETLTKAECYKMS